MRGNVCLGVISLCLGLLPVADALACSWDLNGVGYPPSCGYRGGGGGGGYVAPAPYVPPQPSPAQIAAAQARPINQAGINAEKAGNLALAVSLFEQAVRLSPGDAVLVNNLRHARSQVIDNQGIEAARAGNWALALALYQQALQLMPTEPHYDSGRATLRSNIQQARNQLDLQQGREKQLQQDRAAAANVQQTVQNLAQSLSAAPAPAAVPPSGGLSFIASNPAAATPAEPAGAAPAGSGVQLNPGARLEAAAPEVKAEGAIKSNSAKGQLLNSVRETTGQLFDNGRAHDDTTVNARFPDIATPPSQSPDVRFANNKDYQAAATELARTQIAAETLNKKMATLLEQQKTSPTPERQAEIYNLSGQLHEAGGAVAIATNNIETVKKKIIQEGPAIVVDDGAPTAGKSTSASGKP
jgi:hypothetical protein